MTLEKLQQSINLLVNDYIGRKAFSACSLGFFATEQGVTYQEALYHGKTGFGPGDKAVSGETYLDLASLTKPMATSLAILLLVSKGTLKLDDRLEKFFGDIPNDKAAITLLQLINHTSGLCAHQPYYLELIKLPQKEKRSYLIAKILGEKLCDIPGKNCIYSDLGFFLLGCIVEQATGLPLALFFEEQILAPLAIDRDQIFFKNTTERGESDFAATGICKWSGKELRAIVHDDNCRALGGVAGHAGLFATLPGMLAFTQNLLLELQGKSCRLGLSEEILSDFSNRERDSSYVYGFDTPSPFGSSSGRYFSCLTFGHLGFTGTSFWMDLKSGCGIVLLTNRVLSPDGLQSIKTLRPQVHDLIMSYLTLPKRTITC